MKIRAIHIQDYKINKAFTIDFTNHGKPMDKVVLAGIEKSAKWNFLGGSMLQKKNSKR